MHRSSDLCHSDCFTKDVANSGMARLIRCSALTSKYELLVAAGLGSGPGSSTSLPASGSGVPCQRRLSGAVNHDLLVTTLKWSPLAYHGSAAEGLCDFGAEQSHFAMSLWFFRLTHLMDRHIRSIALAGIGTSQKCWLHTAICRTSRN